MHLLLKRVKKNIPKLLRFGIVGGFGAAINFTVYYAAFEFLHLGVNLSALLAFGIAVINNYIFNHLWTFRAENGNNTINFRQFSYYLLGNIQGLIINLVILNLVVSILGVKFHLIGQMLGIFCGMLSNFIFAKKFVFPASVNQPKSDIS
jgi:putative flippase GtrA